MELRIRATPAEQQALLDLPWEIPLAEWPERLFRRDAGAFAAYLVDAETGDLHDRLSDGQREHDIDIARTNIAGELMDLQAAGSLDETVDAVATSNHVVQRYEGLWQELTDWEAFDIGDRWRIAHRVERLNQLGFDVAELDIVTDIGGQTVHVQPKVVDVGHHNRRLLRLTGIDAQENQARRLLNDLDTYAAAMDQQGEDEEIIAGRGGRARRGRTVACRHGVAAQTRRTRHFGTWTPGFRRTGLVATVSGHE